MPGERLSCEQLLAALRAIAERYIEHDKAAWDALRDTSKIEA